MILCHIIHPDSSATKVVIRLIFLKFFFLEARRRIRSTQEWWKHLIPNELDAASMKVMTIFGTRPEIIRLSIIFRLLDRDFNHIMVNTNQNYTYELNEVFFNNLSIRKPDYNLNIKTGEYGVEVADIILKSNEIIKKEKPEVLLILGDTNSGLSAIPAARHRVKIAHLEAGMRSYDNRMPEESNRVLIDHLSTILLPYTTYSRENLIRENIHPSKIFVVGNPIVDVIEHNRETIERSSILKKLNLEEQNYFLVTAHRSENVDDEATLKDIFTALGQIFQKYKKRVIFPIHPRTSSKIKFKVPEGVELIDPLGYFDFALLEKKAFCLISDSGTTQEEALYFGVPCVTIRKTTERPETVEAGSNIVAGLGPTNIVVAVDILTRSKKTWQYTLGDGNTSSKVINILQGMVQ
jgi:UDP-N-acetylglucosamine 2-epimerase (non-hydrolysing)